MNRDRAKAVALAKIKNGEDPESISVEIGISPAIIQEWAENLTPKELVSKEVNVIALQKAKSMLSPKELQDTDQLKEKLLALSLAIVGEVGVGLRDCELAKAINISADTVAKLQNAFFAKPNQIAMINNVDNNADNNASNENLNVFRSLLRK